MAAQPGTKLRNSITMDRHIRLEGLTNFRDLGGYETVQGGTVRWRTVFRSDTLAALTDNDIDTVCRLGVTTACDLRYADEREIEPSRLLGHDRVRVLPLGLDARPNARFLDSLGPFDDAAAAARAYLIESYRQYPFLYADAYRSIFGCLAAGERVVIHCTAGKDRAGTAAALVLSAMGVPRETVFEDYLLTNVYWERGDRAPPGMDAEVVAAIFTAREEYLSAAFDAIDSRFGSVETYLTDYLGLDRATMDALRAACLG